MICGENSVYLIESKKAFIYFLVRSTFPYRCLVLSVATMTRSCCSVVGRVMAKSFVDFTKVSLRRVTWL